jgi:hypothetical protein
MHWEKIPIIIGGKDVLKEELAKANKQDIPLRIIRFRQHDGKEVLYWEKLVSD